MLNRCYMVVSAVNWAQDVGDLSSFRVMLSDPVLTVECVITLSPSSYTDRAQHYNTHGNKPLKIFYHDQIL